MEYLIAAEMAEVQNPMKALNNLITKDISNDVVSDNVIAADTTRYWNPLEKFRLEVSGSGIPDHQRMCDEDAELENQHMEFTLSQNECSPPMAVMPKPRPLTQINVGRDAADTMLLDQTGLKEEKNTIKMVESRKAIVVSESTYSSYGWQPTSEQQGGLTAKPNSMARNKLVHSSRAKNGERKQRESREPQAETPTSIAAVQSHLSRAHDRSPHPQALESVMCQNIVPAYIELINAADMKKEHGSRERKDKGTSHPSSSNNMVVGKRVLASTKSNEDSQGKTKKDQSKQNIFQKVLRSPFTKRQKAQHTSDDDSRDPM